MDIKTHLWMLKPNKTEQQQTWKINGQEGEIE